MVENVITTAGPNVPVKTITASRGKAVRAEPIAALYAQGKVCPRRALPAARGADAQHGGRRLRWRKKPRPPRRPRVGALGVDARPTALVRQRAASAVNAIEAAHRRPAWGRHNQLSALERASRGRQFDSAWLHHAFLGNRVFRRSAEKAGVFRILGGSTPADCRL